MTLVFYGSATLFWLNIDLIFGDPDVLFYDPLL